MVRRKKVRRFAVPGADELQKLAGQVRGVRAIGRDAPPTVKQMEKVGALIRILRERAETDEQYSPLLHAAQAEQNRLRRYPPGGVEGRSREGEGSDAGCVGAGWLGIPVRFDADVSSAGGSRRASEFEALTLRHRRVA